MPPPFSPPSFVTPGYASGASQVPGIADPRVDSVRANLAPQEAVLNAGAADMVGRGLIDVLNAMGNLKMGMPAPPSERGRACCSCNAGVRAGNLDGRAEGCREGRAERQRGRCGGFDDVPAGAWAQAHHLCRNCPWE